MNARWLTKQDANLLQSFFLQLEDVKFKTNSPSPMEFHVSRHPSHVKLKRPTRSAIRHAIVMSHDASARIVTVSQLRPQTGRCPFRVTTSGVEFAYVTMRVAKRK